MKRIALRTKLYLLCFLLLTTAGLVGALGLRGIQRTNRGLETVYNDRVVPLRDLKIIADLYAVSIIDAVNKANAGLFDAPTTRKHLEEAQQGIRRHWQAYLATRLTEEEEALAGQAAQLFVEADSAVAAVVAAVSNREGSLAGELAQFDGGLYTQIDPISGKITELVELQLRVAAEEYAAATARYQQLRLQMFGLLGLALLGGGTLGWYMTWRLSRTISRINQDLTSGAEQTTAAAGQVSSASQNLAQGASSQASSLEETTASLEELSSTTRQNAESASAAAETARQARLTADQGAAQMQGMQEAMSAIQHASSDVAQILKTIDEIAFQTNILALNAAVEAARAGDSGAGFAVVAEEVRALAQRSAVAAREISVKINTSVIRCEDGSKLSTEVASNFTTLQQQVRQVEQRVGEIARATGEQSQGIQQINNAICLVDKVTQSNAASAEECASASEELHAQALMLKEQTHRLAELVNGAGKSRPTASPSSSPAVQNPIHARADHELVDISVDRR